MWLYVAVATLAATGCGSGGAPSRRPTTAAGIAAEEPGARIDATAGVRQRVLGGGAQTVTVLEPAGQGPGPRPVVVFLHGWGALSPQLYGPWLVHLVRRGSTVVYPRYQASVLSDPTRVLVTTVAGLRRAFALTPPTSGTLVVAGHSAGGALAADYAALAGGGGGGGGGLPVPAAVFAAYPGRSLRGFPVSIPAVDPAGVPKSVDVVALGSRNDTTVGTAVARRIGRLGRYVGVTDPSADDHRGPLRSDVPARRTFWDRLDALIARARR